MWFTGNNKAYFTGKCTFTLINRATGEEETIGNCITTIDITDGDLPNEYGTIDGMDKFAITVLNRKTVLRQVGTPKDQIELGGGNIGIHK